MQNSIYITYNPNSIKEETLANDLYNKGRRNGYFIYLPERTSIGTLSHKTKANINSSKWFVVFSTSDLSDTVKKEIDYALQTKADTEVIVIYSSHRGRNIDFSGRKPIEMFIDNYDLNSIENFKNDIFKKIATSLPKKKESKSTGALEAVLGIGAAVLLISALASKKD